MNSPEVPSHGKQGGRCRLPIADCRLPIADCRLPIAVSVSVAVAVGSALRELIAVPESCHCPLALLTEPAAAPVSCPLRSEARFRFADMSPSGTTERRSLLASMEEQR
jgi:hypothetical protein